jgi:hypothetical protein
VSKYHFKNFPGPAPDPHSKGREGREGGEGETGEERKGEGMGWEGKGGEHPQIKFYDYSTVHSWWLVWVIDNTGCWIWCSMHTKYWWEWDHELICTVFTALASTSYVDQSHAYTFSVAGIPKFLWNSKVTVKKPGS